MPFFLVPVAFLAVSGAAGAKGAYDTYHANQKRKEASNRNDEAQAKLSKATALTEKAVEVVKEDYGRLMLVRLSALDQLDEVVDWLRAGSVKGETWNDRPESEQPDFAEWKASGVDAKMALGQVAASIAGGAGVRAGAMYAAGLGTASTGAAISGLSGAAARSAALAWLGGGAIGAGGGGMALGATVLSGLNVGFAALGVGFTARKLAAAYDTNSKDFAAKADVETENQIVVRRGLSGIGRRTKQLRRAINPIGFEIRRLLDEGDPTDAAQWGLMVGLAKALSRLARYKISDEAGNLAKGWINPYNELGPLCLEKSDEDFIARPVEESEA